MNSVELKSIEAWAPKEPCEATNRLTAAVDALNKGRVLTAHWPALCVKYVTTGVPKLFVKAEPGGILASDALVDFVRGWPTQPEVTVAGVHFVQEELPDEIGRAIAG
jgi:hypothetical protein